jgi:hypothetical protein
VPSFTITAAGQKVDLDGSGAGQAAFTVTNTSTETLKGRLLATPQGPAKQEWFTVDGEPLRDFAPNAAEQVAVEVKVPPGSPPGSYSFRLDAVSEVNPDEDFTEGPSVAFQVAPPKEKKKPFPWWIVIVAAVVVIGIGVLIWLLTKGGESKPATPTVTNPPPGGLIFVSVPAPIKVQWNPVTNASYRVVVQKCPSGAAACDTTNQVFRDKVVQGENFLDVVYDDKTPGRVRVTAIVKGKESDPSEWRPLTYTDPGGAGGTPPKNWCIPCFEQVLATKPEIFPHPDEIRQKIDQLKAGGP